MKKMTPALLYAPSFGRFIGEAFRQHKAWASGNILLRCLAMSVNVFWPLYIKLMTDELVIIHTTQQVNWERIVWINILGFSLGWFMENLAAITANVISASRVAKMRARIRMFILNDMFHQSQQFFHDRFAGAISTSMRDISESVSDVFTEVIDRVIPTAVIFVVLGYIFFQMNTSYVFIMIVWMIFQITLVCVTRKKAQKKSRDYADKRSQLFGNLIDSITNSYAVSSFAAQKNEQVHIAHSERELVNHRKDVVYYNQKIYLTTSSVEVVTVFVGFISVFMYQFFQGQASVGDFMFVLTGLYGMLNAIKTLSDRSFWLYEQIGIGQDAIRKIIVPHAIKDSPNATELKISKAEIIFDKVAFAYFDDKPVLQDVSITIRSGEKIGLIGYSGAGKTTLVNLLLRFFELTGGRILIDGQDITQVTQHSLRRSIALIPQDTSLFHRTLRENIRIANPTATEEQVITASRLAGAHDFIMSLPLQYDTMVGERGIKLSGGQRQRVAIARAFLKDAPILLLDEATSALDSMTEKQIQDALDKVMQGRTTLVIAHRLSTLSRMDRILVFDKGQIIEQGNHAELLAQNGHYAQMWAMQAGGFMPDSEPDAAH